MIPLFNKALFFVLAGPAVLRAGRRLYRHRDERFDLLADTMRTVPKPLTPFLCNPAYLAATADRLAPFLPPRGHGRCFKRSLLLLDLWSRCGLQPTLHLGATTDRRDRAFHAWVTTHQDGPWTSDGGHDELWSG